MPRPTDEKAYQCIRRSVGRVSPYFMVSTEYSILLPHTRCGQNWHRIAEHQEKPLSVLRNKIILNFDIKICFEFRISNLEFLQQQGVET